MDETTIPCPSCHEPLDLNATSCPVCLRSRSAREITRGIRDSRPEAKLKKTLSSKALKLFVAGIAVLGFVYAAERRGLLPGGKLGGVLAEFKEGSAAIGGPNSNPEAALAAKEQEERDRLAEEARAALRAQRREDRVNATAPRAGAEADAGPASPTAISSRRAAAAEPVWRVHGVVYDLLTLKPVAGAKLTFRASDKTVSVSAGKDGAYRAKLPSIPEGGYDLSVKAKGYGPGYLEEMSPPLQSPRSRAPRRGEEAAALRRHRPCPAVAR